MRDTVLVDVLVALSDVDAVLVCDTVGVVLDDGDGDLDSLIVTLDDLDSLAGWDSDLDFEGVCVLLCEELKLCEWLLVDVAERTLDRVLLSDMVCVLVLDWVTDGVLDRVATWVRVGVRELVFDWVIVCVLVVDGDFDC